jgi:hypothetical protein
LPTLLARWSLLVLVASLLALLGPLQALLPLQAVFAGIDVAASAGSTRAAVVAFDAAGGPITVDADFEGAVSAQRAASTFPTLIDHRRGN